MNRIFGRVAALDDYGVMPDTLSERIVGRSSLDYILGDADALISEDHIHNNRLYAVAFPVALAAIERGDWVGEDSRRVVLSLHLTAHLVFLAGGFFAWLPALRLAVAVQQNPRPRPRIRLRPVMSQRAYHIRPPSRCHCTSQRQTRRSGRAGSPLLPHFHLAAPQLALAGDPLARFDAAYRVIRQVADDDASAADNRAVVGEVEV